jgi:hypothetical protein
MKLALRREAATDATVLQRAACAVIRARLVSDFCHGGIVIDGDLYHATATHGVHKVPAGEWTPERWDLFDVGNSRDEVGRALFEANKGMKYDWFSLLAFVGLRVRDASHVYCFEWCYWVMTGKVPTERVTAETLLIFALEGRTR